MFIGQELLSDEVQKTRKKKERKGYLYLKIYIFIYQFNRILLFFMEIHL